MHNCAHNANNGIDEDTDSDAFLDNGEIVDTPFVNKIVTEFSGLEVDNPTVVSTNKTPNNLRYLLPTLTTCTSAVSPVHIHYIGDLNLDRLLTYDADLYDGNLDMNVLEQTVMVPQIPAVPNSNTLSLEDISCFIDTLLEKDTPMLKQFTSSNLKHHINDHWRLKIRV